MLLLRRTAGRSRRQMRQPAPAHRPRRPAATGALPIDLQAYQHRPAGTPASTARAPGRPSATYSYQHHHGLRWTTDSRHES